MLFSSRAILSSPCINLLGADEAPRYSAKSGVEHFAELFCWVISSWRNLQICCSSVASRSSRVRFFSLDSSHFLEEFLIEIDWISVLCIENLFLTCRRLLLQLSVVYIPLVNDFASDFLLKVKRTIECGLLQNMPPRICSRSEQAPAQGGRLCARRLLSSVNTFCALSYFVTRCTRAPVLTILLESSGTLTPLDELARLGSEHVVSLSSQNRSCTRDKGSNVAMNSDGCFLYVGVLVLLLSPGWLV